MSAGVTAITSGEELLDAARAGARDIEILGHLDLRGLRWHVRPPSVMNAGGPVELMYSQGDLRSMRVRACTTSMHAVVN